MKSILLVLLAAVTFGLALPSQGEESASGSIEAAVVTEDGQPVPGARVYYVRLAAFVRDEYGRMTPIEEAVSGVAEAGSNGEFAAHGLPPGKYHVCARGTGPNQLGSCDWGGTGVLVTVPDTGAVRALPLVLTEGTLIRFHVTSARDLLQVGSFYVGLMDDAGRYQRAVFDSTDGTNYYYHAVVPTDARVRLFVDGKWAVRDGSGRPIVTKRPNVENIVLGGAAEQVVYLTVD